MNLEGATLKLLLHEKNKDKALAAYSELRQDYFSNSFRVVLRHIKEFYAKNGSIPSCNELEVYRSRDKKTLAAIASIKLIDITDIDIDIAVEELANQHAQNYTLDLIEHLLGDISMLSRHELLDKLALFPIKLEETLTTSEVVYSAKDIPVFTRAEDLSKEKMLSGISDQWDYEAGGYYRQELVLLGGKRGSGKSIFCCNLMVQQHKQGNVSVYCTIEMTAKEVFHRIICILAQVNYSSLRMGTLSSSEERKLAKSMSDLFVGGDLVFEKHFTNPDTKPDVFLFQEELQRDCKEKDEGRMIIIDDRDLTAATVDVKFSTYKSIYGDKFTLGIVDYLNQLVLEEGADPYDWKVQTTLGKVLQNHARKSTIALVAPYQMADDGSTRFAKGILDAADLAQLIVVSEDKESIALETTKARSSKDDGVYHIHMDWDTLTIDPTEIDISTLSGGDTEEEASEW